MLRVSVFGGSTIDGSSIDPGERLISLALFGGAELDFTAEPPLDSEVVIVSVFGATVVKVRPEQAVRISGLSLFSAQEMDPRRALQSPESAPVTRVNDDDADLPLEIIAYSVFGGLKVERHPRVNN